MHGQWECSWGKRGEERPNDWVRFPICDAELSRETNNDQAQVHVNSRHSPESCAISVPVMKERRLKMEILQFNKFLFKVIGLSFTVLDRRFAKYYKYLPWFWLISVSGVTFPVLYFVTKNTMNLATPNALFYLLIIIHSVS